MDDVRAVMNAAGVERAALLEHVDGAAMAILFAVLDPAVHRRARATGLTLSPAAAILAEP